MGKRGVVEDPLVQVLDKQLRGESLTAAEVLFLNVAISRWLKVHQRIVALVKLMAKQEVRRG